MNKMR